MHTEWKPDIVIYHANCADGFGAAWAVHQKYGDDVEYIPSNYHDGIPDVTGKKVLVVDFSFKPKILFDLTPKADGIIILDHHEGALKDICEFITDEPFDSMTPPMSATRSWSDRKITLEYCHDNYDPKFNYIPKAGECVAYYDVNRSGAVLTWDFIFPESDTLPELLKYIQDRDLWKFKDNFTKPFSMWLRKFPMEFNIWTSIEGIFKDKDTDRSDFDNMWTEANVVYEFYMSRIEDIIKTFSTVIIEGVSVPVCNSPYSFASDVCHILLERFPQAPFAASYVDEGDIVRWSLRSREGETDVSQIAKRFGGGGHTHGASFVEKKRPLVFYSREYREERMESK